jgi:hypothetical protein
MGFSPCGLCEYGLAMPGRRTVLATESFVFVAAEMAVLFSQIV